MGALGINDTTGHIDLGSRGCIHQTTRLNNQVLDGLIVGIFVGARELHQALNRYDALVHLILLDSDSEDILVLEGHISDGAIEDALKVDRDDTPSAVGLHAMEDCMGSKGLFGETTSIFNEAADRGG